jgi:hypothetical protein
VRSAARDSGRGASAVGSERGAGDAALQGGLLFTQIRRETTPLDVALDTIIDHIQTLTSCA